MQWIPALSRPCSGSPPYPDPAVGPRPIQTLQWIPTLSSWRDPAVDPRPIQLEGPCSGSPPCPAGGTLQWIPTLSSWRDPAVDPHPLQLEGPCSGSQRPASPACYRPTAVCKGHHADTVLVPRHHPLALMLYFSKYKFKLFRCLSTAGSQKKMSFFQLLSVTLTIDIQVVGVNVNVILCACVIYPDKHFALFENYF